MTAAVTLHTVERARLSEGISSNAVYALVRRVLDERHDGRGTLVDVGCGIGNLLPVVRDCCDHYVGADLVHYDALPRDVEFARVEPETGRAALPDGGADVVCGIEVISTVENPRAYFRELVRLAKPGGLVLVGTANQLSLLNFFTLAIRHRFQAFQDALYPMQITALLPVDLERMAAESQLVDVEIAFTLQSRLPYLERTYPGFIARRFPRACSDSLLLSARKPNG